MTDVRALLSHPAGRSAVATVLAYAIILAILTVALFLVPYGIFRLL